MLGENSGMLTNGAKKKIFLENYVFLLLFLFTAAIRLFFILKVRYPDVLFGDAFAYDMAGKQILELFKGGKLAPLLSNFFKGNLGNSYGILNSLGLEYTSILLYKGPVYPIFLSAIYFIFGHTLQIVRITHVLSNMLICLILYLLGKEMKDKKTGILAAFLWAIYLPAVFFSGEILPDNISPFFLILSIYLVTLALRKEDFKFFISGAVSLAMFMLCRPVMAFIGVFFLVAIWFIAKENHSFKYSLKAVLIVLLVLLGIYLPFLLLNSFTANKINPVNSASIAKRLFISNLPAKDGWITSADDGNAIHRKEEEGSKFYLKKLGKNYAEHPFIMAELFLKKLYRLLEKHEDTNRINFLVSQSQQLIMHRFIVFFGLTGIFLVFHIWQKSLLVSISCVYIIFIYPLLHIESRYNLPLMPLMALMSGYSLGFFIDSCKSFKKIILKKVFFVSLAIPVFLCFLMHYLSVPVLIQIFPKMAPAFANAALYFIKDLFILSISLPLYLLISNQVKKRHAVLVSTAPLFIMVFLFNIGSSDSTWHEWSSKLSNPGQYVYQKIILPQFNPDKIDKLNLEIDMSSGAIRNYDLIVEVNGKVAKSFRGLPISEGKFDLEDFYMEIMKIIGLKPDELRQWFTIPLDPGLFKGADALNVKIFLENVYPGPGNFVRIYGDYRENPYKRIEIFKGPSFALNKSEISHYKFAYSGDYRIDTETALQNLNVYSAFFNGYVLDRADLSSDRGIQSGEYRVRLQLLDKEGNAAFY